MPLISFKLHDWRQFGKVEIDFHERLTILTGTNGTGKSTLLSILARYTGWKESFYSSRPDNNGEDSTALDITYGELEREEGYIDPIPIGFLSPPKWFYRALYLINLRLFSKKKYKYHSIGQAECTTDTGDILINHLKSIYTSKKLSALWFVPKTLTSKYINARRNIVTTNIEDIMSRLKKVLIGGVVFSLIYFGMFLSIFFLGFIPSHSDNQTPSWYSKISGISIVTIYLVIWSLNSYYAYYNLRKRYQKEGRGRRKFELSIELKNLVGIETDDLRKQAIRTRFINIINALFDKPIAITNIEMIERVLQFKMKDDSTMSLDSLSHGEAAVVDIVYQLSSLNPEISAVVLMDEFETHLHPGLQRRLLYVLLKEFPRAQFIIATHSPFLINTWPESRIYALRIGDDNKVYSELVDLRNKAGTANEVLQEALGVDFTRPIWVEDEARQILREFIGQPITKAALDDIHSKLKEHGLGQVLPDALEQLTSGAWEHEGKEAGSSD